MLAPLACLSMLTCGGDAASVSFVEGKKLRLPIFMEPFVRENLANVRLFVSRDKGKTWKKTDEQPATALQFVYTLPSEGEFWFSIQTVSKSGVSVPSDVAKEAPSLRIMANRAKSEAKPVLTKKVQSKPLIPVIDGKRITVPILLDDRDREAISAIRLFVSDDRGKTWKLAIEKTATATSFEFVAPAEGRFLLDIRIVSKTDSTKDELVERFDWEVGTPERPKRKAESDLDQLDDFIAGYHAGPPSERGFRLLTLALKESVLKHPRVEGDHRQLELLGHALGHAARNDPELREATDERFAKSSRAGRLVILHAPLIAADDKSIGRVKTWLKGEHDEEVRAALNSALVSASKGVLPRDRAPKTPHDLDLLWADFLITGEYEPVARILDLLDEIYPEPTPTQLAGSWSMQANLRQHPRLRERVIEYLERTGHTRGAIRELSSLRPAEK